MTRKLAAAVLCLAMASQPVAGRDSLNFYVPEEEVFPDAAEQKKPEPAPTPEAATKPAPKPAPPAVKATPKPATEKSTAPAKPPSEEKEDDKSAAADIDLRIRSSKPTEFDPPLDPFGIARAFKTRWDFSSFLVSAEEELKFRLDAARARTLRLARAFSALSDEVEARQRNLNAAALAAYLLAQDQHSWVPVEGRNLTEAQLLAVRVTMRQDIAAMNQALHDYEVLRNSLNGSAEEVAALEKKGLDGLPAAEQAGRTDRITVPTGSVAANQTRSVLEERLFSVEALKAALAVEHLKNSGERRQSIASFAPPPPEGRPQLPRASIKPPEIPSEDVMKHQPKGESVPEPEKTALVFETPVNAPVHAVQGGVVVYAGPFRGYGNMVIIEHQKGLFSVYSHLGNVQVLERQPISAGDIIGRAGNPPELSRSGVHFQVRKGKVPMKPQEWLKTNDVQRLLTTK